MQDSWDGLGEYFSHEDKHGDPLEVGRDQAGGTYIATGRADYRTVTYVTGVVPQLVRALYGAEALTWPGMTGPECRAFYSPDSATQYHCTRARHHQGPHLDDGQNTLWVSGWQAGDASGYQFLDARSDADKRTARPLCAAQLTWDQETGGMAQCVLPDGHTGLHGLGPNSGDYLSGRPVEELFLELLRRVGSLEQVTGRTLPASLGRVREESGHVHDEPVRLQCDVYDWCARDRGHPEDCSELR